MEFTTSLTYFTVTPESSENGDYADHGFCDTNGNRYSMCEEEVRKDVKENANLYHQGFPNKDGWDLSDELYSVKTVGSFVEADCYPLNKSETRFTFNTSPITTDYSTGEEITYSFHVTLSRPNPQFITFICNELGVNCF